MRAAVDMRSAASSAASVICVRQFSRTAVHKRAWVDELAVAERGGCLSACGRDCRRVDEPAVAEGGGYCAAICGVDPVGDEVVAGPE